MARAVLATPSPHVLVLDDLQWCDGETLAWLRFLLRFDPHAPLLVIGAARSEAIDPQHPLHDLRQQLQRAGQWSEVTLAPLTSPETAVLAGHLTQSDVRAWAPALYRETEGNPLFVVEMVRAGYAEAVASGQPVGLPQTIQAVIEERLCQLSPQARQLAQTAATFGRRFTVAELSEASGFSEGMLVAALDELWQRRIVRSHGDGYCFSNNKIREVDFREISAPRLRSLNKRIGNALTQIYDGREDEVASKVALRAERAAQTVCAYADARTRLHKAFFLIPSRQIAPKQA